jgi:hypothetical protein
MTILELAAMSNQFDSFEALHLGPGLCRDEDFGACCDIKLLQFKASAIQADSK